MKNYLLKIWYNILYHFDNNRNDIPIWWYENKSFEDCPDWMQRVLIAKDIIEQINTSIYIPVKGNYIENLQFKYDKQLSSSDDIKSNFNNIEYCEVCALGACLMSLTKFKNQINFDDINKSKGFLVSGSKIQNLLLSLFSPEQIALIESAFEGGFNDNESLRVARYLTSEYRVNRIHEQLNLNSCNFYFKYSSSEKRLIAIMENIINNKGTFKP